MSTINQVPYDIKTKKRDSIKKELIDYYQKLKNQNRIATVEEIMLELEINREELGMFFKEYNLNFREQGMLPMEMTILFHTKFKSERYNSERTKLIKILQ